VAGSRIAEEVAAQRRYAGDVAELNRGVDQAARVRRVAGSEPRHGPADNRAKAETEPGADQAEQHERRPRLPAARVVQQTERAVARAEAGEAGRREPWL